MSLRDRVAQSVMLAKQKHPERYCARPGCLWRVVQGNGKLTPCRKHPICEVAR